METRFVCPKCATKYSVQGRPNIKVQCPACGTVFESNGSSASQSLPHGQSCGTRGTGRPPRLPSSNEALAVPWGDESLIAETHSTTVRRRVRNLRGIDAPLGLTIGLALMGAVLLSAVAALVFGLKESNRTSQVKLPKSAAVTPNRTSDEKPVGNQQDVQDAEKATARRAAGNGQPKRRVASKSPDDETEPVLSMPERVAADVAPNNESDERLVGNQTTVAVSVQDADKIANAQATASEQPDKPALSKPANQEDEPVLSMPDLIEAIEPSVVRITGRTATDDIIGSGFVVGTDGSVATNFHVIEGTKGLRVEFANKAVVPVRGYRILDPDNDLAILQIDSNGLVLRPLRLAMRLPKKGESVATFGAPYGLGFTASNGIVSASRTAAELAEFGSHLKGTVIQTSAPISGGNSGGPLVDMHGTVVGVNTASLMGGQNLNFAVSSMHVQEMLNRCDGKVHSAMPRVRTPKARH